MPSYAEQAPGTEFLMVLTGCTCDEYQADTQYVRCGAGWYGVPDEYVYTGCMRCPSYTNAAGEITPVLHGGVQSSPPQINPHPWDTMTTPPRKARPPLRRGELYSATVIKIPRCGAEICRKMQKKDAENKGTFIFCISMWTL